MRLPALEGTDNAFGRYRDNVASLRARQPKGQAAAKIRIDMLPQHYHAGSVKEADGSSGAGVHLRRQRVYGNHPAGKAEDNAIEWYGPLYLQMRYGK